MAQQSGASFLVLLITVMAMSILPESAADSENTRYQEGDYIPVFASKIFPIDNECDARPYYDLPFCPPGNPITSRKKTFEQVIASDCFTNSQYELRFNEEKRKETLCEKNLTKDEVAKFRNAVRQQYEFVMYYNNIRLQAEVGKVLKASWDDSLVLYYVCKHLNFYVFRADDKVGDIYVMCDFDSELDVTEDAGIKVNFTYSVFRKGLEESSVFWPSEKDGWELIPTYIFCTTVLLLWIKSLFDMALHYLSGYFIRYSNVDIEDVSPGGINMKLIHGDSCRCPPYPSLLGAFLGVGTQMAMMSCTLIFMAFLGVLNLCSSEALTTYILLIYCFTSVVSGYIATSFHLHYTAIGWRECIFQTGVLYFAPVSFTIAYITIILALSKWTPILPKFSTSVIFLVTWAVGTILLLVTGGKVAHAYRSEPMAPCNTRRTLRQILQLSWYRRAPSQTVLGGLLPFFAVLWDMDTIYATLYSQKICGAYRTLFMDFILVIALTVIVGAGSAYVQRSREDNKWWWRSVFRGGSTAIFMFAYGIYFLLRKDEDSFFVNLVLLGYNTCIFYAFFFILGSVSLCASLLAFRSMSGEEKRE